MDSPDALLGATYWLVNGISFFALVVLLTFGIYFSSAEMAFASLNRSRIKGLAESGGKRGRRAALVMDMYENRFDEALSTLLIGNNTVAIIAATLSASLAVRLLGETWGWFVSTVLITVIVIVFTDIIPKGVSKAQPEKVALFAAPLLNLLMKLFKPLTWLVLKIKESMNRLFVNRHNDDDEFDDEKSLVEQELIFMVEEAEKEGSMNEDDSTLITNAIEFNELEAGDILTPRVSIVSIPVTATIEETTEVFLDSGYARMPVYEGHLDKIVGVVHLRDILKCRSAANKDKALGITDVMQPAVYTVATAHVTDLLNLLKKEKTHMAFVTDEYGGTEGLVTMEDILEQLVGDIWDESDEIIEEFLAMGDNRYKVICTADIEDMFEYFDIENVETDANSVGGWINEMLRHTPEEGESFTFDKLLVTVTKSDGKRAEECVIEVIQETPDGEHPELDESRNTDDKEEGK